MVFINVNCAGQARAWGARSSPPGGGTQKVNFKHNLVIVFTWSSTNSLYGPNSANQQPKILVFLSVRISPAPF